MPTNRIVMLCGGVLAAGLVYCGLGVHAAGDQAGLYSAAQAKRGEALYGTQCAMCHGADLTGVAGSPPLTGDNFLSVYSGQSILTLFDKVQRSMPASDPGSLTPAQTADLLAYVLSVNKYAAGDAELPADQEKLKAIQLPKPEK